jgi:hypothetical protein
VNVVELLDDLFQRAGAADEPLEMNYIRKHVMEMTAEGLENPTARLFSNPAGDYGSMVNERVGAGNWEDGDELGNTWAARNSFSYGRGGECGSIVQTLANPTEDYQLQLTVFVEKWNLSTSTKTSMLTNMQCGGGKTCSKNPTLSSVLMCLQRSDVGSMIDEDWSPQLTPHPDLRALHCLNTSPHLIPNQASLRIFRRQAVCRSMFRAWDSTSMQR